VFDLLKCAIPDRPHVVASEAEVLDRLREVADGRSGIESGVFSSAECAAILNIVNNRSHSWRAGQRRVA
jgi:hypothetical protein